MQNKEKATETKIEKINDDNHVLVDGKVIDTLALKVFRPTLNLVFWTRTKPLSESSMLLVSDVHIYAQRGVFTYIIDTVAGVYNAGAATTEITLKADADHTELFSSKVYKTENKKIILPTDECPTQMLVLK